DFHASGPDPRGYHRTNVLLHVLNAMLVFWFIALLSGSLTTALVAALFFGIHPLHVESVAWISGRKDLVYTLFYLASCIVYLAGLRGDRVRAPAYLGALLLFLLSLLSKGMAVTLPVVLVLMDLVRGRRFTFRLVAEKAPFLILSLLFGVIAIVA